MNVLLFGVGMIAGVLGCGGVAMLVSAVTQWHENQLFDLAGPPSAGVVLTGMRSERQEE